MTRPCASRNSALELSPWANGRASRLWGNPGRPGRAERGPAPGLFRRSQLCTLWLASATAPAISGALFDSAPNVGRRSLAGIQRSELLPSRDAPAGLSNRARRTTPFVAGVCLRDGRQRWGVGCIQATRDRWVSGERALCSHKVRSMGPVDPVLPTRSAGVSMDAK